MNICDNYNFTIFDIIKLVIAVISYSHIDNYDAHIKLRIASKAYRTCTENINTNVIFNVTVKETPSQIKYMVCGVGPAVIRYYEFIMVE